MANIFPIKDLIKNKDGGSRIKFPSLDEMIPGWKVGKQRTDTNIQKLKDDLSKVLYGDSDSLKRIIEYTLKRKQEIKEENEGNEFLQDVEFIHQVLAECDEISPPLDVFKHEPKFQFKNTREISGMARIKSINPNLTKSERNEMYMLSVIAYDLISLEESQKSPIHMSQAASGFKDSLSHMQEVLQVPDDTARVLENKANKTADYGFTMKLIIHKIKDLGGPNQELSQSSGLFCRVGCLSKEMVEQKKLNLKSKGLHVNTTRIIHDSVNPVWNEEFQLPLGCEEHYLLVEVWRTKIPQQGKKKSTKGSDEYLSRCLLKLDPTMKEILEEDYELTTTAGKGTSADIIMSLKILANTTEPQFLTQYDPSQKLAILQKFVYEITYYLDSRGDSLCFGKLTEPFQCIKCKLIEILKLSKFQVTAAAFDCPEIWGKNKNMNRGDIEKSLDVLKSEWDRVDGTLISPPQRKYLTANIMATFENELKRLENVLIDFPPNELESKQHIETTVITIIGCYMFLVERGEFPRRYNIKEEITKAITNGINNWYTEKSHSILDKSSLNFRIETLITLCDCILLLIQGSDMNYRDAFSTVKVDYSYLFITKVDAKLAEEIEQARNLVLGEDKREMYKLQFMMFHLYRKLYLMLKRVSDSNISNKKLDELMLANLEDWFRPFLNYWYIVLGDVCMQSIQTMVQIEDRDTHEYRGSKVSSSAIDIGLCLLPSYLLFTKLENWTNERERFHLALQTIQLNIDALQKYSNSMKDKILNIIERPQSDSFQINAEICVLLNNNYCIRYYIEEAKGKINLDKFKLEDAYQLTSTDELFKACLEYVEATSWECIKAIGNKFKAQFATNYARFIALSQGSDSIDQDIDHLMNWLLQNVIAAVQNLSSDLFLPLLEEMWRQTLECLSEYKYLNENQGRSRKIYASLDYLKQFFHNEGQGITDDMVKDTIYNSLVEHFSLYAQESHELMVKFGSDVSEFCKRGPDNFGSCTFNVAYVTDKQVLEIRIIQVENIPSQGTLTIIYLEAIVLPKYGSKSTECKTKTKKYEKSIVIDESINLSVTTETLERAFVLQINIFYQNTFKMGLFPDYGGSVYLTSNDIGRMHSTDSVIDILKGENEVRKNIKMSFLVDPGECEILTILRDRKTEGVVISNFVESVTQGVKDEKMKRMLTEGVEETMKFFNKFLK